MFKSNLNEVLRTILEAEERAMEKVGQFGKTEAQLRCPVDSGELKKSTDYMVEDKKTHIGAGKDYSEIVHEGSIRQRPQRFISDAIEQNIDRIKDIIEQEFKGL